MGVNNSFHTLVKDVHAIGHMTRGPLDDNKNNTDVSSRQAKLDIVISFAWQVIPWHDNLGVAVDMDRNMREIRMIMHAKMRLSKATELKMWSMTLALSAALNCYTRDCTDETSGYNNHIETGTNGASDMMPMRAGTEDVCQVKTSEPMGANVYTCSMYNLDMTLNEEKGLNVSIALPFLKLITGHGCHWIDSSKMTLEDECEVKSWCELVDNDNGSDDPKETSNVSNGSSINSGWANGSKNAIKHQEPVQQAGPVKLPQNIRLWSQRQVHQATAYDTRWMQACDDIGCLMYVMKAVIDH